MIRRAIKRDSWQGPDLVDSWMVTFTDLLTLLVTLFVMLLSMSSLKAGRVAPNHNTTWDPSVETPLWPADPDQVDAKLAPRRGIGAVGARIAQYRMEFSRSGLMAGFDVYHDERGSVLRFDGAKLVNDGRLTRTGVTRIKHLGDYLKRSGQALTVVGVAGEGGNWMQASVAAAQVARGLVQSGADPAQVVSAARILPYPDGMSLRSDGGVEFIFGD